MGFCRGSLLFPLCSIEKIRPLVNRFASLPPAYCGFLALVWVGNLAGAEIAALLLRCTRVGDAMVEKAAGLVEIKADDSLLSLFIPGIFCNILIYLAVESYLTPPTPSANTWGLCSG